MRCILAHPDPLTTRIEERPMTMQSPAHLAVTLSDRRRLRQSDHFGQIELFDGATPAQMPAWRDPPGETRGARTHLPGRLFLEQRPTRTPAARTGRETDDW